MMSLPIDSSVKTKQKLYESVRRARINLEHRVGTFTTRSGFHEATHRQISKIRRHPLIPSGIHGIQPRMTIQLVFINKSTPLILKLRRSDDKIPHQFVDRRPKLGYIYQITRNLKVITNKKQVIFTQIKHVIYLNIVNGHIIYLRRKLVHYMPHT
jgi:hypothetical protein